MSNVEIDRLIEIFALTLESALPDSIELAFHRKLNKITKMTYQSFMTHIPDRLTFDETNFCTNAIMKVSNS